MAKQRSNLTSVGEILNLKNQGFSFQNPILVDCPSTTITDLSGNPRKISDPSKTLKPAIGVERIHTRSIEQVRDEKGSNSAAVWRLSNGDDRIRFVGPNWTNNATINGTGPLIASGFVDDYVEITFYGTGLNLLEFAGATRGLVASVDGGAEGANILFDTSTILINRNYGIHCIYPVVSGLALGNHTVKLRKSVSAYSLLIYGFEILNESTQIKVPQGELFASGRKFTNAALQSTAYNSGFDGSPVLNGRGGRVVNYLTPEGVFGKAIQQTNPSQANLAAANHSNEDVIRRINWREFGANRTDDFSTLETTAGDRAFTLNDGTTSLVANGADSAIVSGTTDAVWPAIAGDHLTLTFVGTGLDIFNANVSSITYTHEIFVDGVSFGTLTGAGLHGYLKIVSGLPYGTHTFRLTTNVAAGNAIAISDFIIYGPKKPSIPDGAVELSEYYLMADFSAAGVAGTTAADHIDMYQGVIHKSTTRESIYVGTWVAPTLRETLPSGYFPNCTTNASYIEHTFWGTGVAVHFLDSAGGTVTYSALIDGVANATGANLVSTTNGGGGSYTTTSTTGNQPARVVFNGLSLGKHTIRLTRTGGTGGFAPVSFYDITPVHFPSSNVGSLSVGPGVQTIVEASDVGVDLGKAKALINFNADNLTIRNSYNIAGFIRFGAGQYIFYFERPFKDGNYYMAGSARRIAANPTDWSPDNHQVDVQELTPHYARVAFSYNSGAGSGNDFTGDTELGTLIFFGELAEESE